jgi:hypothetical protein
LQDPELGIALAWRQENRPNRAWGERYRPGFEEAMAFLEASHQASIAEAEAQEAARQRELAQARELAEEQQRSAKRRKGLVAALTDRSWLLPAPLLNRRRVSGAGYGNVTVTSKAILGGQALRLRAWNPTQAFPPGNRTRLHRFLIRRLESLST